MALSIAQMRESGSVGLPERTIRLCLAQKLVAEVSVLTREKAELLEERASLLGTNETEGRKRPTRTANPNDEKIADIDQRTPVIDARLAELHDEMDEHTGALTIRAVAAGEWRRWADDNPARTKGVDDEGRPLADPVDANAAYGYCNASALLASLDVYAVAWNDAPLGPGDWEWITQTAAPGDLTEVCRQVVQLHEGLGVAPKASPKRSPATPSDAPA